MGCYGHMEEAIDENEIDRKDRMLDTLSFSKHKQL